MSSGEADQIRDDFRTFAKCSVPGCEWMVEGAKRCLQHGGPRVRQTLTSPGGELLSWRGFPRISPDDLTEG